MPEMTEALKQSVLEEIKKLVLIGFAVKADIFITIIEDMFDEDDMDKDWVNQMIDIEYDQHQQASKSWVRPTDFDRLAKAFDELIQQKIIALHNAGIEIRDGRDDSREIIKELSTQAVSQPIGSCFYHFQDLEGVVNPEYRSLFLAFGSVSNNDVDTVAVGKIIYATLQQNGFEVTWNGTADERIRLNNVNWQKVPDDTDYGKGRVIALFTTNEKKEQTASKQMLQQLKESIITLALPSQEQIIVNGPGCVSCDLLNDFDSAYRNTLESQDQFTPTQAKLLKKIDTLMADMLPEDFVCFDNTVLDHSVWNELRTLAQEVVQSFGWQTTQVVPPVEVNPGVWQRPKW